MHRLTAVLAALVLALAACSDSDGGDNVSAADLQSIVDGWAEGHGVSAVAVSVMAPDGSLTTVGSAADDSSLFNIASLTKTMTAATTLLLVEDGVLDLDAPIEQWLPDFPRGDEITLRHLLSHTAGLMEPEGAGLYSPEAFAAFAVRSGPTELVDVAAGWVGDDAVPSGHHYANSGYWVVGAVIEAASGTPLAEVMQTRLFEPLGMADTRLGWPDGFDGPLVPGETVIPGGVVVPVGDELLPGMLSSMWAAGGVLSTSRDVATFYGAVLDDLLGSQSVEAMRPPDADTYGLGIDGRDWTGVGAASGHNGLSPGYSSSAGVTEAGWVVVVLTNQADIAEGPVSGRRARDLVGELLAHVAAE